LRSIERKALKIPKNGKNAISRGIISAENAIFALFSPKNRTWQTMPLKVGFIPGFRGLLTDCSLQVFAKKGFYRDLQGNENE
jgi:hypothetical protein